MATIGDDQLFTNIWADAFDNYSRQTGRDIRKQPTLATLHTTDDLLQAIEHKQQDFDQFRYKQAKLWEILHLTMKPVELLGDVAKGALGLTPFAPASAVFGAVLFLIGVSLSKPMSSEYAG